MRRERVRATLTEELFKQGVATDLEMCRNVSKDGRKGPVRSGECCGIVR